MAAAVVKVSQTIGRSVAVAGDVAGVAAAQGFGAVAADAVFDDAGFAVVGGGEDAVRDDGEVGAAADPRVSSSNPAYLA